MKTSRKLVGLVFSIFTLTACAQPLAFPVRTLGLKNITDYYSAFEENRYEVKWSPDGQMIAIRMLAPDMSLLGIKSTTPYKHPQDVLRIYDANSGRLVAAWNPETSAAEASNLEAFRKSRNLNLQWSADSRKVFVLEPKTEYGLLQSLVLFSFDVYSARNSMPRPNNLYPPATVRDIVFPDSLRKAGSLKLSLPALSPEGTQLAMYREGSSGEPAEVMTMDLISGEAKSLGQIKGSPSQPPLWGPKTGKIYVSSNPEAPDHIWMQRFSPNAAPEELISAYTQYGNFSLSPDERFIVAALDTQGDRLLGYNLNPALSEHAAKQDPAAYGTPSYDFIGLLHDLASGEEHYFKSPVLGSFSDRVNYSRTDQSAWDYRNTLNYTSDNGETLIRLDPSQKIRTPGFALNPPKEVFKSMIKPFLTDPGNFVFGTRSVNQSLSFDVLAFSPKDSRMVLGGFSTADIPLERFKLFHIWNPEQQKMLSLKTSYLELTDDSALLRPILP